MSALKKFEKQVGSTGQGSGGKYLIRCVMSGCNDFTKINLRTASYRLDYNNKILLIELIKAMILKEDELWFEPEIMEWIEKNQPYTFKEVMDNNE
jgi:hypothetical protein